MTIDTKDGSQIMQGVTSQSRDLFVSVFLKSIALLSSQ